METISYTTLRQNLSSVMEQISNNRDIVHITRKGHESMVMIAESDFNSLQETLHLLSNPRNSKRLEESFKQAKDNEFTEVDLNED